MTVKTKLTLLCFLTPFLAGAGMLDAVDVYASLTGKTVLMPSLLPFFPDAVLSDLPTDKTNAVTRLETEFSKQGIAVIQDGPHFVILLPEKERAFLTKGLSLRGAELAVAKSGETLPAGTIRFINCDVTQVLPIYASISHRTILRSITLHSAPVCLKTACPLSREEAIYAFATVFALNGVAVVQDGQKFVQAVPMIQRSMVAARAPKPDPAAKLLNPKNVISTGNYELSEALLPGNHEFSKAVSKMERDLERWGKALFDFMHYKSPPDAQRLLGLYATLVGKAAEPSKEFDGMSIWFHIETPLSKSELMYAIEATFDLNWLRIDQVDDQRIRLSRISDRGPHTGKQDAVLHIAPSGPSSQPIIVLTSKDVDTNSVRVITQATSSVQNLVFRYVGKTSAEIEAIVHRHPQVQVVQDGRIVTATDGGCGGLADDVHGQRNYVGLVLIFDNYDQAKLAEKTLRRD